MSHELTDSQFRTLANCGTPRSVIEVAQDLFNDVHTEVINDPNTALGDTNALLADLEESGLLARFENPTSEKDLLKKVKANKSAPKLQAVTVEALERLYGEGGRLQKFIGQGDFVVFTKAGYEALTGEQPSTEGI